MNNVQKTLYIPLFGKALVSRKGLILSDKKAEEIWQQEGFPLRGKAASKWLAYYMGMRSFVFDAWVKEHRAQVPNAAVLHLGCGMDSRSERIGTAGGSWWDLDFPEVIRERKRYYSESEHYHMLSSDVRETAWLKAIPEGTDALVVMEGISMYLTPEEMQKLLAAMTRHLGCIRLLVDTYTPLAAKISRYKNPIKNVGVSTVYGVAHPAALEQRTGLHFIREHSMTPAFLVDQLKGMEKCFFRRVFCGSFSKRMYCLYEYQSE